MGTMPISAGCWLPIIGLVDPMVSQVTVMSVNSLFTPQIICHFLLLKKLEMLSF